MPSSISYIKMPYFVPSVGNSYFRLLTSFQKIKNVLKMQVNGRKYSQFGESLSKLNGVKKLLKYKSRKLYHLRRNSSKFYSN